MSNRRRVVFYYASTYPWFIELMLSIKDQQRCDVRYFTQSLKGTWGVYSDFNLRGIHTTVLHHNSKKVNRDFLFPGKGFVILVWSLIWAEVAILVDSSLPCTLQVAALCFIVRKRFLFINAENQRLKPFAKRRILRKIKSLTEIFFLKRAHAIIADSASAKDDIIREAGELSQLIAIPHGTRIDVFKPRARNEAFQNKYRIVFKKEGCVCLFNGGFYRHKGIEYLTDAIMRSGLLGVNFVLVGYGDELDRYSPLLSGMENVVIIPMVPAGEMPHFYSIGEIFILPSITTETDSERSPNTLIEAMASGLACVVSSIGGIPSYVSRTALVIPERDSQAIVDGIASLAAHPGVLRQRQLEAREHAERNLDIVSYAAKVHELIQ